MLFCLLFCFFFFNDTATTEIYTLSLHDALPISRGHPPGLASRTGRNRRPSPRRNHWTLATSRRWAARSGGRASWRWNILGIFGFNLLLKLRLIRNAGPAVFDLWLRDFGFHSWRRNAGRRLGEFRRCSYHELVTLHFGESSGFSRGGQISDSLPLDSESLNRTARVCADHVIIRAVIIDHIVLNSDVGHVHRVTDIGNVLR